MTSKQCPFCKKTFELEKTRGKPKKFCSSTCRLNNALKLYRSKPKRTLQTKNCIVCGKAFKSLRTNHTKCSKLCAQKNWKRRNKDKVNRYARENYERYKEIKSEKHRIYIQGKGKEKRKKLIEKWKQDGTASKHQKKYYYKIKKDPVRYAVFKIVNNCRNRVRASAKTKDTKKSQEKKIELIGCTSFFLKRYLEKKFKKGMTWENYGTYWEVDHIIPLSRFDITIRSERNKANHYTNLQPLEADINRKLGDKKGII